MQDHYQTARQALKENFANYFRPSLYHLNHRLDDVCGLSGLDYDLFILDRDCTLHGYHATKRVPEFEETLKEIGSKSELVSNSSYNELLKIRDVFGDVMPISKLVNFNGFTQPFLLRFIDGKLSVLKIYDSGVSDVTSIMSQGDTLFGSIVYNFKKPNPKIIDAVITANKAAKRIPDQPRVLMVGDRYLTDIVAGNLAGVDTARVKPYKPLTDKPDLIAVRYVLDSPLGNILSRL